MSAIDEKVKEAQKVVENINPLEIARTGLAIVGGVAIAGGLAYLVVKNVRVAKAAETVVEKAPELIADVEKAAEVVL